MFNLTRKKTSSSLLKNISRKLKFEHCEDRRMLTTMADIVFLVDESGSAAPQSNATTAWLQGVVERMNDIGFSESLTSKGITIYGMVWLEVIKKTIRS